jgi:hypothetical protein
VRGQLDLLVPPLGGPEMARDQAGPMDPSEVTVDEPVAALGLVGGAVREAQEPLGVFVPRV